MVSTFAHPYPIWLPPRVQLVLAVATSNWRSPCRRLDASRSVSSSTTRPGLIQLRRARSEPRAKHELLRGTWAPRRCTRYGRPFPSRTVTRSPRRTLTILMRLGGGFGWPPPPPPPPGGVEPP